MPVAPPPLPEEVAALQALVRELQAGLQRFESENARLAWKLAQAMKLLYGPRADRLRNDVDVAQMQLAFAESLEARPVHPADAEAAGEPAPAEAPRRVRRRGGRRNLANFDRLPLRRVVHELTGAQRACGGCGAERQAMGQEVSWQIEHVPAHFERIEHVRLKYACAACERAAAAPQLERAGKPAGAIDKGMAGPGLLAYIVTSKFADYLPLYRLEDIFRRHGFEIARATQSIWCGDVADLVEPLYQLMAARVRQSHVIGTDDTVMPMLAPGRGATRRARVWVYLGDDAQPYNVFDFTESRGRDGPRQFLGDYNGVLVADAYGGYDGVVAGNAITRAGCWAHARRKFVDAEKTAPAIAAEAAGLIGQLYAVEREAHGLAPDQRLALRRQRSLAVLAELEARLREWPGQLTPRHPMAEAVGYARNQWAELNTFAHDGAVPIDNNASEREMKRVVLNRKNSLFVGNARGGRTAAILASLTSTCRRHDIDPERYFTQLLVNLPETPITQLEAWLPDRWKVRQDRLLAEFDQAN